MPDKEKEGMGLPPISGLLIILIAVGAIWINKPLKSSRPTGNGTSEHTEKIEDVHARLWQDPFDVIHKHKDSKYEDPRMHKNLHSPHVLTKIISGKSKKIDSKLNDIHVIGVMVAGGPYVENTEQRRRRRYAVLSALNVSGYKPNDAQHIGYFLPQGHKCTDKYKEKNTTRLTNLPDKIPFELFEKQNQEESPKGKSLILLIWLDEDLFGDKPLSKINALADVLHLTDYYSIEENEPTEKKQFTIIGPASSTTLRSMMKELGKSGDPMGNLKNVDFKLLSPTATAANKFIFKDIKGFKAEQKNPLIDFTITNKLPWNILRTIKSDYELGLCLKNELKLRGVDAAKDNIVLISEWDTDYGRWLPDSIAEAFNNEDVRKYSYMRGLDGQTLETESETLKNLLNNEKEQKKNQSYAKPPIGKGQIDYLRRLTNSIRKKHRSDIKAIGVLGSDVYDKLLILQALRKRFPSVIFFTTDLDSRYVYPDEFKWVRNLIVASNFGLELNPELQKDIPPFRGNYQTSIFFSTLLALSSDIEKNFEQYQINNLIKPKIFEMGRYNPCELVQDRTNENKDDTSIKKLNESFQSRKITDKNICSIYPAQPKYHLDANKFFYLLFIVPAGSLLFFVILAPKNYKKLLKYAIVLFTGICFIYFFKIMKKEPLLLLEGISIWPAEFIRIFSCICSLTLAFRCKYSLKENIEELGLYFFKDSKALFDNDEEKHEKSVRKKVVFYTLSFLIIILIMVLLQHWNPIAESKSNLYLLVILSIIGFSFVINIGSLIKKKRKLLDIIKYIEKDDYIVNKHSSESENDRMKHTLRENYRLCKLSKQLASIIIFIIFFLVCVGLFFQLFGIPNVPYRGNTSLFADNFIIISSICLFLHLLFDVVIKTMICISLVPRIMDKNRQWSIDVVNKFNVLNSVAGNYWLKIILIAKHTKAVNKLINYPIWSILLIFISFSTYFDNWIIHQAYYVLFGIGLSLPIICAWQLRKAANKVKDETFYILNNELIRVTGEIPVDLKETSDQLQIDRLEANKQAQIDQIKLLINNVRVIRDGAFAPFFQQPFVQAIIYIIGLIGVVLSQYSARGY